MIFYLRCAAYFRLLPRTRTQKLRAQTHSRRRAMLTPMTKIDLPSCLWMFFYCPFTWWHRGAARAIQLWNILCTRRYKWELLRILAEHLAQSERPSWIQVERTWDLVRDSGQRKLTYSSQNHCTSSRSVYLSRRLNSHWERFVITHHLQKWESQLRLR